MSLQRRYRDENGEITSYSIVDGINGGGLFDVLKKVGTKLTGKVAKDLATKAATKVVEKGAEKVGEKTGQLIGEKIYDKFSKPSKEDHSTTHSTTSSTTPELLRKGKEESKGDEIIKMMKSLQAKPANAVQRTSVEPKKSRSRDPLNQQFQELLKL